MNRFAILSSVLFAFACGYESELGEVEQESIGHHKVNTFAADKPVCAYHHYCSGIDCGACAHTWCTEHYDPIYARCAVGVGGSPPSMSAAGMYSCSGYDQVDVIAANDPNGPYSSDSLMNCTTDPITHVGTCTPVDGNQFGYDAGGNVVTSQSCDTCTRANGSCNSTGP